MARWYHVSPEVFLAMPISDVALHLHRSAQCDKAQRAAAGDDD